MTADRIARFRRLIEDNPDNELARYSLGTALFDDGKFEEAQQHLERALEHKRDWVLAYIYRARCLLKLGREDEARGLLETGRKYSVQQGHDGPIEEIDEILEEMV